MNNLRLFGFFSRLAKRSRTFSPVAIVKPFPALLPDASRASEICELPYDVMSPPRPNKWPRGGHQLLHVSRPEIDLPEGTATNDPSVYAKARENFDRLIAEGALRRTAKRTFTCIARSWASIRSLASWRWRVVPSMMQTRFESTSSPDRTRRTTEWPTSRCWTHRPGRCF